jgi:predicted O-methyltransferase YrrM
MLTKFKARVRQCQLILSNLLHKKNYSQNWGSAFLENTQALHLKNLHLVLEIGCFEGLTSNYIVDQLLEAKTGKLICVDPLSDAYLGSDPSKKKLPYFSQQFDRFIFNTKQNSSQIKLIRKTSSEGFTDLLPTYKNAFDLIYIDGDHRASVVYNDAINCFELCKKDGIMIFDDYTGGGDYLGAESTKHGVDEFISNYSGKYELLLKNSQVALRKK